MLFMPLPLRRAMPRIEERIWIRRPPKEVHAFIQDFARYPEWIPFAKEVTVDRRTEGFVGTTYTERGTGGTSHWRVVGYEENRREVHEGDIGIATVRIEMTLVPAGGATDYRHVIEYEPKMGLLGRAVDRFVLRRKMRDGTKELVRNLKRIVEEEGRLAP